MRSFRAFALGIVALAALVGAVFVGARSHDGPLAMIPGGPLRSGEWVEPAVTDWRFATDHDVIELQLESQSISRTTWILVREGVAYIPCRRDFPPGKSWYEHAQRDGRAILRVDGRLHRVQLTRDDDPALPAFARPEVERKYATKVSSAVGVMFFRVEPRS